MSDSIRLPKPSDTTDRATRSKNMNLYFYTPLFATGFYLFGAFIVAQYCNSPISSGKTARYQSLREALLSKYDLLRSYRRGIFHEDISDVLRTYLMIGMSLSDTKIVLMKAGFTPLELYGTASNRLLASNRQYYSEYILVGGFMGTTRATAYIDFNAEPRDTTSIIEVRGFIDSSNS